MSCAMSCPDHHHPDVKIDLHVHTTTSDGAYSPGKIVELAWEKGIRILAITDHDTTRGLEEAAAKTIQYPLDLIPGIELSTIHHDQEVHILGYYIRPDNPDLRDTLDFLADSRLNRVRRMADRLKNCGIDISFEEVMAKGDPAGSLGRPHVALALIEKGVVKTIEEAFNKYLNPGRPGYVPRHKISPVEAITLIKKAGGIPVLAHPGINLQHGLLPSCLGAGLQGMEVYYPQHDRETERKLLIMAEKLGLIITGGSDFHGHEPQEWQYFGEIKVPPPTIRRLKDLAAPRNPD